MLRILYYSLITLTLCSCGSVSDAMKMANEAKAMSQLKKFYSGQMINMIENEGSLVSFKELYENKYFGEFIDEELYRAWDGNPEPDAQNGYLYSEIIYDQDGNKLNRFMKAGLVAYPENPDRSGGDVIAMLIDMDTEQPDPGGDYESEEAFIAAMQYQGSGNEWNFYRASAEDVTGPVTNWPSESDLQSRWVKVKKHRAGDSIDINKMMSEQLGNMR